jgi:hypothetical protein
MQVTYWAPNQSPIAQVETYTFSAPNSVGNTYKATINGKVLTYTSVTGDTATTVAAAMLALLQATTNNITELTEITFDNPSNGVITATAKTPGTPFANVLGTTAGLVMSTGNGLVGGITTVHTQANQSPSDVNDPQNWLRVTTPAPGVRALPVSGDNLELSNSTVPMLWNLDQLANVQFASVTRTQSMEGIIGLLRNNPNGYTEWRAQYFKFIGPPGSAPAGGLPIILGKAAVGNGPAHEFYDAQSQQVNLTALASGNPDDEYGIRFLGVHTNNSFTALGGVSLGIAMQAGEIATLSTSVVDGGATVGIGPGVTWTAASTLSAYGGTLVLNAAPATLVLTNGAKASVLTDQLTWATITMQAGCTITWLAGGTITTFTMSVGCDLDKSGDSRTLTITNSTIDGDTCRFLDPLNAIVFTNATTVKQRVQQGPFQFTGTRTVKVT